MRAAPPVSLNLGTGRRERAAVCFLVACAGLASIHWTAALLEMPVAMGAELLLALALGAAAWWLVIPLTGRLSWDGRTWSRQLATDHDAIALARVQAMIDLGGWVLLRADARWCGVSRGEAGPAWHGLRVALLAQGGAKARA